MEKGAEETVQNCNFLDSKISDLTASMLEKTSNFKKGVKFVLTLWLQWHYPMAFGIITAVTRMTMCSFFIFFEPMCVIYFDIKIKSKNCTFLTASLPNPSTRR